MKQMILDVIHQPAVRRWAYAPGHRLAIGWIAGAERWTWSPDDGIAEQPSARAIYEVGSITKTMTGLLLAIGENEGLWSRDDKLSELLPDWAGSPFAEAASLRQLVTHSAGLPRIPGNMQATIEDKLNPYAKYTDAHLKAAVLSEPASKASRHAYSNYGFGLLGYILAARLGTSLSEAMLERLFAPLGMEDTLLRSGDTSQGPGGTSLPSGGNSQRLVDTSLRSGETSQGLVDTSQRLVGTSLRSGETSQGLVGTSQRPVDTSLRSGGSNPEPAALVPVYNAKGAPTPHWDFTDAMAGAGAVCSTVPDMLRYLAANLEPGRYPIGDAIMEGHKEHYGIFPDKGIGVGYSWMFYREKDGSTTHWHNGGTYGSSSFIAFNRDKGRGLVILSNRGADIWSQIPLIGIRKMSVDKLARKLLNGLYR